MSTEDRYYVSKISGYPITASRETSNNSPEQTSYSVLDRYDAHREVGRFYTTPGGKSERTNRREAYAETRRRNAIEANEAV